LYDNSTWWINYDLWFKIEITDTDQSLPVALTTFTAETTDQGVLLQWITESEFDNLGFIIERREKGQEAWQQIAGYQNNPLLIGQGTTSERTEYDFLDSRVQEGILYEYRLANVDVNGMVEYSNIIQGSVGQVTNVEKGLSSIPSKFELSPAFPNPFNPQTTIHYSLQKAGDISIQVYDINGRQVATLTSGYHNAGQYEVSWNAKHLTSGTYLVVLISEDLKQTQKVLLLK
jgi:hypothetical protein